MHADELRQAVAKIVATLKRSDIRNALDRYRAAKGEERAAAAARLGHAGAVIMERMEGLSPVERRVARLMHLELLGSPDYWQSLLGGASDPKTHQAEIVRLASRVMFAASHLPALVSLLEAGEGGTAVAAPGDGEARLVIRLADAGEKASDPDRIARSIDGIDMLYSACASIARKPAMDLRLDGIDGGSHRDLRFTGERDSLSAVIAVIDSIPAALADIDPDGEIDLEAIIGSLPVFEDLRTLGSLGTFTANDLKDINETMHQGALLVLESGVVLVEQPRREPAAAGGSAGGRVNGDAAGAGTRPSAVPNPSADGSPTATPEDASSASAAAPAAIGSPPAAQTERAHTSAIAVRPEVANGSKPAEGSAAAETDEHYEHYLREREAMRNAPLNGTAPDAIGRRRDAVEELLRSLDQTRNG